MNRAAFDFTDANVLVTGGTSGIGHAIATAFARGGANVTITGTRESAGQYDAELARFSYRQCQLKDPSSVDALVESLGKLDILVNNAGAFILGSRDEWEPDAFLETVQLNLTGPMRLTVGCRERLKASTAVGGGSVLNLSSLAALRAVPELPGYCSAKAAVLALTSNLARRWARDGIRVNAVVPGLVATPMSHGVPGNACVLGRAGTPEEIAATVLFLCSDAATYITGAALLVDGGNSTR